MGFPYFKPLFLKQALFHVHRCPFHEDFVRSMLARMLAPPNFPVKYSELAAEHTSTSRLARNPLPSAP